MNFHMIVLRKSFYIRWSAGRSPRVHEVNPGRDPSVCDIYFRCTNLFVHFVAIYVPLCAIADDRTSSFCCLYRWAIYDL